MTRAPAPPEGVAARPPRREGSVWLRRLLTIPAVLGLALLGVATAPVWIPGLLVVDLFRRRRLASLRAGGFALAYLLCESAGILAAFGLWLGKLALRPAPERYADWNYRLQCWWGAALFEAARRVYGFELDVEVEGDLSEGPVLLFLRHASLGDTLLGVMLFSRPHGLRFRYVLKEELLWDPCLDIVGNRVPNTFVRRGGDDSLREIQAVAELARDLGPCDGVLIYPEGTRFTPGKQRRVVERLKEKGDTERAVRAERLRHVLPPRPGGPLALLETAPDVDVVICMHQGFEAAGSAGDLWSGRLVGARIHVRCVRYPADSIPPLDRAAWLMDRWDEVDAFVASHAPRS